MDLSLLPLFVEQVINARGTLQEAIRQAFPEVAQVKTTSTYRKCAEFLGEDPGNASILRVMSLLLALAVLQCPDPHGRDEGLCLLGLRGTGAHERERRERRRLAALARRKPLYDPDWYVKRHLPHTVARIASDFVALFEHPELLEEALQANGRKALINHVTGLRW